MAKGFTSGIDKNVRNNCICLFIAIAIIGLLALKGQDDCRGQSSYVTNSKRNAVTGFMVKYMQPCAAPTHPRFKAPNAEIAQMVGEEGISRAYYRYANPQVPVQRPAARYSSR